MAHLQAHRTRRHPAERLAAKLDLARRPYERRLSREEIVEIIWFLDWLLPLPAELERQFEAALHRLEEERQMPYVSRLEQRAIERGLERGLQEGREQGIQQGIQQGAVQKTRADIVRVLHKRFGDVPPPLEQALAQVDDLSQLDALFDEALSVTALSEFSLFRKQAG